MVYVFLIFMVGSAPETDKYIIPMKDMAQCEGAIEANNLYDKHYDENHWVNSIKIAGAKCVEVRQ